MPRVRKLRDDEVRPITQKPIGTRKATEIEYDGYLADFQPGDYGDVMLGEGDKRLTVRNRLQAAARRRTPPLTLVFHRMRGPVLRFAVEAAERVAPANPDAPAVQPAVTARDAEAPAPALEPPPLPQRRGRPPGKKNTAASTPPAETAEGRGRTKRAGA